MCHLLLHRCQFRPWERQRHFKKDPLEVARSSPSPPQENYFSSRAAALVLHPSGPE